MPSRPRRIALCSIALGAFALVASAACTFPTVEYRDADAGADAGPAPDAGPGPDTDAGMGPGPGPGMDAGPGPDAGPPCTVSSRCANLTKQCFDDLKKSYESCTHLCSKSDQKCVEMCNTTGMAQYAQCVTSCEDCGHMDGCANPTASCLMLFTP